MQHGWDDPDEATTIYDPSRSGASAEDGRWYISRDGRTKQQQSAAEILEQCREGSITEDTLVWREGLPDWASLGDVPELARALRAFSKAPKPHGPPPPVIPPGLRPSLPSLPPPPSLPPVAKISSASLRTSSAERLSQRVAQLFVDERLESSVPSALPSGVAPLSFLSVSEPYSLRLPGGHRVGVLSLATAIGVFTLSALLGAWLFGDEAPPKPISTDPILIDLDDVGANGEQ